MLYNWTLDFLVKVPWPYFWARPQGMHINFGLGLIGLLDYWTSGNIYPYTYYLFSVNISSSPASRRSTCHSGRCCSRGHCWEGGGSGGGGGGWLRVSYSFLTLSQSGGGWGHGAHGKSLRRYSYTIYKVRTRLFAVIMLALKPDNSRGKRIVQRSKNKGIMRVKSTQEQAARVRVCNFVEFESLPPVLKIVTHTAHSPHRHKPLLLTEVFYF